ncbi:YciI family protein [bacterium]|nr:MAG: YciI family protein [bacterium]
MNYLLLMYLQETPGVGVDVSDEEVLRCALPVVERTSARGQYLAAGVLRPTATATSVRVREGHRLVTDGPFAETREHLAGYLLVEAKNLDEAIAIAEEHPAAQSGTVEIRPILVLPPAQ